MERGEIDLETIVKNLKDNKSFTPSKIRFYWEQMLEATAAIHEKGIIHADIKPANFLMIKAELHRLFQFISTHKYKF